MCVFYIIGTADDNPPTTSQQIDPTVTSTDASQQSVTDTQNNEPTEKSASSGKDFVYRIQSIKYFHRISLKNVE